MKTESVDILVLVFNIEMVLCHARVVIIWGKVEQIVASRDEVFGNYKQMENVTFPYYSRYISNK